MFATPPGEEQSSYAGNCNAVKTLKKAAIAEITPRKK